MPLAAVIQLMGQSIAIKLVLSNLQTLCLLTTNHDPIPISFPRLQSRSWLEYPISCVTPLHNSYPLPSQLSLLSLLVSPCRTIIGCWLDLNTADQPNKLWSRVPNKLWSRVPNKLWSVAMSWESCVGFWLCCRVVYWPAVDAILANHRMKHWYSPTYL